jgi:hypothetical protein
MIERPRSLVVAALAAALLAACSAKSSDDAATPSASPALPATAAPAVAPTAAPTVAATAAPTTAPTTEATVVPKAVVPKAAAVKPAPPRDPAIPNGVPIAANDAPPKIVAIVQSPVRLQGGASMTFDVTTSSNVASVELRAQSFGSSMKRTKIGKFTFSSMVPPLPPLVPHTFAVSFIARNSAGVSVTQTITTTIH